MTDRLPSFVRLARLCKAVREDITALHRAFPVDAEPGIQLTIGWNPDSGDWSFQTGDNSFAGPAYFFPLWAVIGVYRDSSSIELARDLRDQLLEQLG